MARLSQAPKLNEDELERYEPQLDEEHKVEKEADPDNAPLH